MWQKTFVLSLGMLIGAQAYAVPASRIKNVIIMIPDGTSVPHLTLARWVQDGKPLELDALAKGLVRTHAATSPVTDSAPAATAMATGYKSHTGFIGILPDSMDIPGATPLAKDDARKPVVNIFEAAKRQGKALGLVATSQIQHATPAGFSAHTHDRNAYEDIAEQQVYFGVDVVLGGGSEYLQGSKRKDKEDLMALLREQKVNIVDSRDALLKYKPQKGARLWGFFAPVDLPYDYDRDPATSPSLAELTEVALKQLSTHDRGFFLMVEGSKIDWASHANDAVGIVSDVLAFDKAVGVAKKFAESRKDTIILIAPDHGNSGLSLGNQKSTKGYDKLPFDGFTKYLKQAKRTLEGIGFPESEEKVAEAASLYGLTDLSAEELNSLKTVWQEQKNNKSPDAFTKALIKLLAERSNLGWTTGGHTGEDTPFYCYHPQNRCPTGVIDNTEFARFVDKEFKLELDKLNAQAWINADKVFMQYQNVASGWDLQDINNVKFVVKNDKVKLELPANKNIAIVNGKTYTLSYVNVITQDRAWVSKEVVNIFEQALKTAK